MMIYSQCIIFSLFFIIGIIYGIEFDIFRCLRSNFKTGNIMTYIEDVLYIIIIASEFLYAFFIKSYGEIRFYIFVAIFLGVCLYSLTIQKLCVIILNIIFKMSKKFILCFILILKIPIKFIKKVIQKTKNKIRISHNK